VLAVDCEAAPDSGQMRCKWYGYFPTVFEFDLVWKSFYPSIFDFDLVWKSFYPSIFDFEYSIFITDPYPNAQNLYFYDVDIYYNFIRQKLTLSISDSVFEHKYKNKYDISDIRPYSTRFRPCLASSDDDLAESLNLASV
jgi:hypothetical protein